MEIPRLSDEEITRIYNEAGARFGDVISPLGLGLSPDFERLLGDWRTFEKEYASRGFRTVPLDAFIDLVMCKADTYHLLQQKREENESPVFHAQEYIERHMGAGV